MKRVLGLIVLLLVVSSVGACDQDDDLTIVAIDIDDTSVEDAYAFEDFRLESITLVPTMPVAAAMSE